VDREIAADNARADALGLIFDSDPRRTSKDGASLATETEPNTHLAETTSPAA
jgi:capsid protein